MVNAGICVCLFNFVHLSDLAEASPGTVVSSSAICSAAAFSGLSLDCMRASIPGGRHDNDSADYRSIKILPTPAEVYIYYCSIEATLVVHPCLYGLAWI